MDKTVSHNLLSINNRLSDSSYALFNSLFPDNKLTDNLLSKCLDKIISAFEENNCHFSSEIYFDKNNEILKITFWKYIN